MTGRWICNRRFELWPPDMRRTLYVILGVLIIACFAPVLAVFYSSTLAERHGCTLHEGFVNPCIIDGVDKGATLSALFVSGWLMLVTLPLAAVLAIILAALIIWDLIGWLRRRRTE